MEEIPNGDAIASRTVLRWIDLATGALGAAREEIDALNVYPVPDSDTGTNLHLTLSAAREAYLVATAGDPDDVGAGLSALARGALLGARGNSGVILSEMLGAFARGVRDADPARSPAQVLADALDRAARNGYAAVGTPVEGTMLSVAAAAAAAATALVADPQDADPQTGQDARPRGRDVIVAAAAAARTALARTPEQLAVLARAGVVDAGGRGVCVLLDAAETAVTGRRPAPPQRGRPQIPVPTQPCEPPGGPAGQGSPGYEVMYLLDAEDEQVAPLRSRLGELGDSVAVVGGDGMWHVHVHVDDVGAAVEAGIVAGRPHRVRVTRFEDQATTVPEDPVAPGSSRREGRAVVAVAAGPGLAEIFAGAGARVVEAAPGRSPATGELLAAIVSCGANEVVVLVNDAAAVGAAQVAAETAERDAGLRVAVVATHAQVQGLAALAVHEPGRAFDLDVTEMTATARHVRHGAVTVAAGRAMTMGGPCEPGDALGVVAGDFVVVDQTLQPVAVEVLRRLLAGGGELVTIVTGAHAGDLGARTSAWLESEHPFLDVVVYDGGQDRYPLLLSVE